MGLGCRAVRFGGGFVGLGGLGVTGRWHGSLRSLTRTELRI
jgi:hypothetical protein